MAVAAVGGTDLIEPDELRATTQENAAQEERPDPVQVQGIPARPIIVRKTEKISILDKMTEQENCAAKAMRHRGGIPSCLDGVWRT